MAAASSAAAQQAAIANAIKASGAIVSLEPDGFLAILARQQNPLVVQSVGGFFSTSYQYLTSYKGLTFHTKSPVELALPASSEIVRAGKIWIPG